MDSTSDILDQVDRLRRRDCEARALWRGESPMQPPAELAAALRDAVEALERGAVPYMLIGGRSGAPVQLAFDAAFDAPIERAMHGVSHGRSFRLVTRADLIALKERASRDPGQRKSKALRDQADVEQLREGAPEPDEGW